MNGNVAIVEVAELVKIVSRELDDVARKQMPFATVLGLTLTAKAVQADIKAQLPKIFDRPTPWTINSIGMAPAKFGVASSVFIRSQSPTGTPASKYLGPEIEGGHRRVARFERRINAQARIPEQMMIAAKGATLDGFGNMQRAQINRIIRNMNAMGPFKKNKEPRKEFFVGKAKANGQPLAIYQIVARGKVVPVIAFLHRQPDYSTRFPFQKLVQESATKHFLPSLQAGMAKAMASRR